MKVLVVGNGAREHAICWKLSRSPRVKELYCAPGNPGIGASAELVPIEATNAAELASFASKHGVDLVVVGPEAALAAGVVDRCRELGVPAVGPTRAAAQLESSKAFAKEVMQAAGVPTAGYEVFTSRADLEKYIEAKGAPLVLKSDGLASGKGVFVILNDAEFAPALDSLFGSLKAECVVAEEYLVGVEVSCIFATDGESVVALPPAHDYKRLLDDDQGPNTGGMGAVCPTPRISTADLGWVSDAVAAPVVAEMKRRGTAFQGFLYAGLMVPEAASSRPADIKVLEFNARLGDPECQAILSRMSGDFLDVCLWIAGKSAAPRVEAAPGVSTCVVIASNGYPEAPVSGDEISGLDKVSLVPGAAVFHAATQLDARGKLVAKGGRTLSVVGTGADYEESRNAAYKAVDLVQMRGRRVRRDIGR